MKKAALLFLVPVMILSSCGTTPVDKDNCSVDYELASSIRKEDSKKTGGYNLTFNFKSEYFKADASVFNKDLALLSDGKALMAESEATISKFYSSLYFDDFESHYVAKTTENTISYAFAHKKIDDFDLISIVIDGHNYGMEWSNNALIGKEGDHEGFSARANDILDALKIYWKKYVNPKLWISGFSRGGAIANVLSHYILSKNGVNVTQKNMFVYTFEAPKGLAVDNAPKYENVFNVIYSGDFIPYLAPTEYGFARCGVDVDLFVSSSWTDEVLYNLDDDNSIPTFKPYMMIDTTGLDTITIESEQEGPQALIDFIMRDGEDTESLIYFPNREAYVNKAQHTVQTVLSIAFYLPTNIRNDLLAALQSEILYLDSDQKLYDLITPFLDEAEYPYDEAELLADCGVIRKLISTDFGLAFLLIGSEDTLNGLKRMFMVHFPEVGYSLLADYNPNN